MSPSALMQAQEGVLESEWVKKEERQRNKAVPFLLKVGARGSTFHFCTPPVGLNLRSSLHSYSQKAAEEWGLEGQGQSLPQLLWVQSLEGLCLLN